MKKIKNPYLSALKFIFLPTIICFILLLIITLDFNKVMYYLVSTDYWWIRLVVLSLEIYLFSFMVSFYRDENLKIEAMEKIVKNDFKHLEIDKCEMPMLYSELSTRDCFTGGLYRVVSCNDKYDRSKKVIKEIYVSEDQIIINLKNRQQ